MHVATIDTTSPGAPALLAESLHTTVLPCWSTTLSTPA